MIHNLHKYDSYHKRSDYERVHATQKCNWNKQYIQSETRYHKGKFIICSEPILHFSHKHQWQLLLKSMQEFSPRRDSLSYYTRNLYSVGGNHSLLFPCCSAALCRHACLIPVWCYCASPPVQQAAEESGEPQSQQGENSQHQGYHFHQHPKGLTYTE